MPIRTAVWKVSLQPEPLAESSLAKERLLEDMIVAVPRLLSDEWMLIGRQEDNGFGGRIDLLAIAPDGSLVLIELKRSRTPREVVAQALDYAGWVEKLRPEDIAAIYGRFAPGRSLTQDFRQRFGQDLDEETLNESHQIIIVASSLDDSTERIIAYPMTPCRLVDTRPGAPSTIITGALTAGVSRTLPILSSTCNVPATAQAYSLNFTLVPSTKVDYLTVYPTGQSQPIVSTLNDPTGTVVANAGITPAGTGGSIDVFATQTTDLVVDINGYFAPVTNGALSLYALSPCRVLDTRMPAGSAPFTGAINVNVLGAPCGAAPAAEAYLFNATVVPSGELGYLSLWANGGSRPVVSTLNSLDGSVTSNMAVVPTANGLVNAYAAGPASTYLILDISGYFAP